MYIFFSVMLQVIIIDEILKFFSRSNNRSKYLPKIAICIKNTISSNILLVG